MKVDRSDRFSEDSDKNSLIQNSGTKSDSGSSGNEGKQKSSGRVRYNYLRIHGIYYTWDDYQ